MSKTEEVVAKHLEKNTDTGASCTLSVLNNLVANATVMTKKVTVRRVFLSSYFRKTEAGRLLIKMVPADLQQLVDEADSLLQRKLSDFQQRIFLEEKVLVE